VRLFERPCDHERDWLALVVHTSILKHVQPFTYRWIDKRFVRSVRKSGRVSVSDYSDDTVGSFRR
jgi:hypothetical protein